MDAQFYQSITGLSNYEGFKSILKNGIVTQRFNIEDENIVFVKVVCVNPSTGPYVLNSNEVGVILNAPFAAAIYNNIALINESNYWFALDVSGNTINYIGAESCGLVVTDVISIQNDSLKEWSSQVAIFALF